MYQVFVCMKREIFMSLKFDNLHIRCLYTLFVEAYISMFTIVL